MTGTHSRLTREWTDADSPAPEEHTMRQLLGDLAGARVLDLACGIGHYTRLAADLGADTMVGVDSSTELIALAQRLETEAPRGIHYHLCDVTWLPMLGEFDVATAVWLFSHASSPTRLGAMFTAVRANLADGGRLLAITVDPDYNPWGPSWEPYGLRLVEASLAPWRTRLVMDALRTPPTRLRFSQWDRTLYERASETAGFTSMTWHPIATPDPDPDEYWRTYRDNPFVVAFECCV